jgi:phenylpyruvate tautomerase PptA (4-oxalocrotonate tautomerase family)
MPLVRVDLKHGKPLAYRHAILDAVYAAMRETFDVPAEDRFMLLAEYGDEGFVYSDRYLGIRRTDDLVIIQITANNTRTVEEKKALFKAIADRLAASPGVRREDVFINLLEVAKENWSFGNGAAQYAGGR